MKEQEILRSNIGICDIHAERLQSALEHLKHLFPIQPSSLKNLHDQDLSFLELLTSRFAKLQDAIGQKIFPKLLEILEEDTEGQSFLDLLNKLEKLEILESVEFWSELRKIRNSIAHEYPDNPELMAENLNQAVQASFKLLDYWVFLKNFMDRHIDRL